MDLPVLKALVGFLTSHKWRLEFVSVPLLLLAVCYQDEIIQVME